MSYHVYADYLNVWWSYVETTLYDGPLAIGGGSLSEVPVNLSAVFRLADGKFVLSFRRSPPALFVQLPGGDPARDLTYLFLLSKWDPELGPVRPGHSELPISRNDLPPGLAPHGDNPDDYYFTISPEGRDPARLTSRMYSGSLPQNDGLYTPRRLAFMDRAVQRYPPEGAKFIPGNCIHP